MGGGRQGQGWGAAAAAGGWGAAAGLMPALDTRSRFPRATLTGKAARGAKGRCLVS